MTERKPPQLSFESWLDRQIREAAERGEFDDLPGAGKPLPDRDQPDDELWWVKGYLAREGLSAADLLPPPLKLRREIEQLPDTVRDLPTEAAVRRHVDDLNQRIIEWLRTPSGPQIPVAPVKVERVIAEWQRTRTKPSTPAAAPSGEHHGRTRSPAPHPTERTSRVPWWRRVFRTAPRTESTNTPAGAERRQP